MAEETIDEPEDQNGIGPIFVNWGATPLYVSQPSMPKLSTGRIKVGTLEKGKLAELIAISGASPDARHHRDGDGAWRIGKLLPGVFSPCRYAPQAGQDG